MTASTTSAQVGVPTSPQPWVVLSLARADARRMFASPLLYLGIGLSALFGSQTLRANDEWSGAEYTSAPVLLVPVLIPIAVLVAMAFHRERDPVGTETPTSADTRAAGILLGTLAPIAVVALLTLVLAAFVSSVDGFDLGDEPGRTLHAHFTAFELLQHVALAVLAVATGAAAGRRLAHRSTAALVLFAGWFPPMFVFWLFQVPAIVPFSVIQVQPVNVRVAPRGADPLTLPADWLLSQPTEYQDYWGRQFVSQALAGWHDLWLLGLACLFLALVFSGRWRRRLVTVGALASVVSITAQYWVIP